MNKKAENHQSSKATNKGFAKTSANTNTESILWNQIEERLLILENNIQLFIQNADPYAEISDVDTSIHAAKREIMDELKKVDYSTGFLTMMLDSSSDDWMFLKTEEDAYILATDIRFKLIPLATTPEKISDFFVKLLEEYSSKFHPGMEITPDDFERKNYAIQLNGVTVKDFEFVVFRQSFILPKDEMHCKGLQTYNSGIDMHIARVLTEQNRIMDGRQIFDELLSILQPEENAKK